MNSELVQSVQKN